MASRGAKGCRLKSRVPDEPSVCRQLAPHVHGKPSWLWRCRLDEHGIDVIDQWLMSRDVTKRAKMNFERRRDQLAQLDFSYWGRPGAARLKNHICVIHFHDESDRQWRVYGFSEPSHCSFVMTNVASEKGHEYNPSAADSEEAANTHREHILVSIRGRSRACFVNEDGTKQ